MSWMIRKTGTPSIAFVNVRPRNTVLKTPAVRLGAIVLDLWEVQNIDLDITQGLESLRQELDDVVEADHAKWFCVVKLNIWSSRLLQVVSGGSDLDTQYENVGAAVDAIIKST